MSFLLIVRPQGIFWLDRNGDILNVNDGASQLLGYTRNELLRLNVRAIDPGYQPAGEDEWRKLRKDGMVVIKSQLKKQDGGEFPAEIHLNYLLYNEQECQFAVVQDITEKYQMEAQMRRQLQEEELLRDVLTLTTNEGDLALTMGTICKKMAHFYGIPRAGFALLDDDDTTAEIVAEYVNDGRISSVGTISPIKGNPWMEHVLIHKDALVVQDALAASDHLPVSSLVRELGLVSLMFVPIMIMDRVVGTLGFDSGELWEFQPGDIDLARKVAAHVGQALQRTRIMDELVNAGQALQKSEEQLRVTLSHLPTPIVIVRRNGTCLYANESFGQMFGATPEYITQQVNAADMYVQVEDRAQLLDDLDRGGQLSDHKVNLKMLNGTELWASVSVYSLNLNGETVLLKSIYDLSEQMRSEQILRVAKDAAESANQTKSLFLSNMTHELRTPMNGVLGMTSILMDTKLDTEQFDIVETIRSSGDTLLTIINDILDFSKIEANKLELELVSFEIAAAIEETTLLVKPTVENKGLKLHYNIDDDVPAWILQDVTRLRQILRNLISNAVKFTSDGEVRIHVSRYLPNCDSDRERTDIRHVNRAETGAESLRSTPIKGKEGLVLHFAIEDTGIGIPAERLFRLFQPFSQVDATTTRRYGGTGLGLAISKQLCELMGGEMWVESELDVGTTFHFTITTMAATAAAIPQIGVHTGHTNRTKPFEPNMAAEHPLRILLVEDNVVNQKVALGILKRLGYRADVAANGLEALNAIKRQSYDVVLMDIQMPEMDGVTATKRIRSYWSADEQPAIIALTANAMEQHREEYLAAGMDGYVSKPIRVAELSEALRSLSPLAMGTQSTSFGEDNGPAAVLPLGDCDR